VPRFEIEHINWIAVREFTLVDAPTKEAAQILFEETYSANLMDKRFMYPESVQVEVTSISKYPYELSANNEEIIVLK
jgi:hypothetical protein